MVALLIQKSTLDHILDNIFEELEDKGLFPDLKDNEEMQDTIKENIYAAINDQKLRASDLKPEFTKSLVLAFISAYLLKKYDAPSMDMSIFFMKENEDNREEYQAALKKFLTGFLLARNNKEHPLNDDQIKICVNNLIVNNDLRNLSPVLVLKLVLNACMKEQQQKDEAPQPEKKREEKRAEEEKQLMNESSLYGIALRIPGLRIPTAMQALFFGNFMGFANDVLALRPESIMADQRVRDYGHSDSESQINVMNEARMGGIIDVLDELFKEPVRVAADRPHLVRGG